MRARVEKVDVLGWNKSVTYGYQFPTLSIYATLISPQAWYCAKSQFSSLFSLSWYTTWPLLHATMCTIYFLSCYSNSNLTPIQYIVHIYLIPVMYKFLVEIKEMMICRLEVIPKKSGVLSWHKMNEIFYPSTQTESHWNPFLNFLFVIHIFLRFFPSKTSFYHKCLPSINIPHNYRSYIKILNRIKTLKKTQFLMVLPFGEFLG